MIPRTYKWGFGGTDGYWTDDPDRPTWDAHCHYTLTCDGVDYSGFPCKEIITGPSGKITYLLRLPGGGYDIDHGSGECRRGVVAGNVVFTVGPIIVGGS